MSAQSEADALLWIRWEAMKREVLATRDLRQREADACDSRYHDMLAAEQSGEWKGQVQR